MADWYCSSVAYTAVAQWAATHTYAVGNIVRQLATPTVGNERCFRVSAITTGISGGSEPAWTLTKGGTTTDSGVTWTECSGNSAQQQNGGVTNTWTAPIARMETACATFAITAGDRIFVSSDHTQTVVGSVALTPPNAIQVVSVNRTTGNIPPAAGDITNGATVACTGSSNSVAVNGSSFWQGLTFKFGTTSDTNGGIAVGTSTLGSYKFLNCTFQLTATGNSSFMTWTHATQSSTWLENCSFIFNNNSQFMECNQGRVYMIGGSITGFSGSTYANGVILLNSTQSVFQANGVDFSAFGIQPRGLFYTASTNPYISLVNCKISPTATVMSQAASPTADSAKLDLINCDSSVGYRNNWWRPFGMVTTDPVCYRSGGASDGAQNISHRYASFSVASLVPPQIVEGPVMSIWNTLVGASHTATIEIAVSGSALNNDDVWMELEYLGDSGDPLGTVGNTLPATVLTTHAAVTASAASWNGSLQWSPADKSGFFNVCDDGVTAWLFTTNQTVSMRADAAGYSSSGKLYCEFTAQQLTTNTTYALGIANAAMALNTFAANDATNNSLIYQASGPVRRNNATVTTIAAYAQGNVVCMALDLTNSKIWFRVGAAGNWNNDILANQNPATNTGGVSISALNAGPYVPIWTENSPFANDQIVANFGATAYAGTPPSGFSNWPFAPTTQKLQFTFTPQRAGNVRATVRLAKASTVVRVDPLITIT